MASAQSANLLWWSGGSDPWGKAPTQGIMGQSPPEAETFSVPFDSLSSRVTHIYPHNWTGPDPTRDEPDP